MASLTALCMCLCLTMVPAIASSRQNITVGLLLQPIQPPGVRSLDIRSFKPPFDIAIDSINRLFFQYSKHLNVTINYMYNITETDCGGRGPIRGPGVASTMYHIYNIQAIFGPLCSYGAAAVADVAAYWNIPILTGSTTADYLEDKSRYQTFTRTPFKQSTLANFISHICESFNWNTAAVLQHSRNGYWNLVVLAILRSFSKRNITSHHQVATDFSDTTEALEATTNQGRGIGTRIHYHF